MPSITNTRTMQKSSHTRTYLEKGNAENHPPPRVEPQEPALKDKGKGKMIDVINIPSSSTSMTFVPKTLTTAWVIRPKVATQEPTMCKTNPIDKRTHRVKK